MGTSKEKLADVVFNRVNAMLSYTEGSSTVIKQVSVTSRQFDAVKSITGSEYFRGVRLVPIDAG